MKKLLVTLFILTGTLSIGQVTLVINGKPATETTVVNGSDINSIEMKFGTIKALPAHTSGILYYEFHVYDPVTKDLLWKSRRMVEGYGTMQESLAANKSKNLTVFSKEAGKVPFMTNEDGKEFVFSVLDKPISQRGAEKAVIYAQIYFRERIGYERYGEAIVLGTSKESTINIWKNDGFIKLKSLNISIKEKEAVEFSGEEYSSQKRVDLTQQEIDSWTPLVTSILGEYIIFEDKNYRSGGGIFYIYELTLNSDVNTFFNEFKTETEKAARYYSNYCNGKKVLPKYPKPSNNFEMLWQMDSTRCIPEYDEKNSTDINSLNMFTEVEFNGQKGLVFTANVYTNACTSVDGYGLIKGKANPDTRKPVQTFQYIFIPHPKDPSKVLMIKAISLVYRKTAIEIQQMYSQIYNLIVF